MARFTLSALRLHQIMYGLVYPAVLGSFLYAFWDKAANAAFELARPTPWVGGALFIALFTLDYAYSLARSVQASYSGGEFLADVLIVMLIYLTAQSLFGKEVAWLAGVSVWVYLFAIKLVSSAWELIRLNRARRADPGGSHGAARPFPVVYIETDVALAIAAVVLGALSSVMRESLQFILLAMFFIVDGLSYIAHTSDE